MNSDSSAVNIAGWLSSSVSDSIPDMAMAPGAPAKERATVTPSLTARNVVPGPISASTRASQPVCVPGEATLRSTCSCASKWLRLLSVAPTACTMPSCPLVHSGSSAATDGCRPNVRSRFSSEPLGIAMLPRAAM